MEKTPENYSRIFSDFCRNRRGKYIAGESHTGTYLDDLDKCGLKIVPGLDHRGPEYPEGIPIIAPVSHRILCIDDPHVSDVVIGLTGEIATLPFDRTVDYFWPTYSMILWK